MKRLLVLCFLVSMFFVVACDDSGNKYILNLEHSGVADGTKVYAKFVAYADSSGCDGAALYFVEADFSGGSATATVKNIASGNYRGCIFIDNNGNAAGDETSTADGGDYVIDSEDDAIVIPDETSVTLTEEMWGIIKE